MFTALLIIQVLLGLAIIGLVLLQQGKGADMGAAFGSGASGTVFGARGSGSFFTRATAVLAALFFANSILLSSPLLIDHKAGQTSVTETVTVPAAGQAVPPEAAPAVEVPPADLPEVPAESQGGGQPPAPSADLPQ